MSIGILILLGLLLVGSLSGVFIFGILALYHTKCQPAPTPEPEPKAELQLN